jgi:molecular chaperone DnaK (HSP70)
MAILKMAIQTKKSTMSYSERDIEKMVEAARKWVVSDEGQQAMENALSQARKVTSQLSEERSIDPKSLHAPFTL